MRRTATPMSGYVRHSGGETWVQRMSPSTRWARASPPCSSISKPSAATKRLSAEHLSFSAKELFFIPDTLSCGLFSLNMGAYSCPATAARVGHIAEEAGFDSLWAGRHVVLPDPQALPSPMAPAARTLAA